MAAPDHDIDDFLPTKASIEKDYDNAEFDAAWQSVADRLNSSLVIAFLGTASSGKTSGIKVLFDIDFGNIHPIPGSTTTVKVHKLSDQTYLVDAPGFGDINEQVPQEAKDICKRVDIFVYVLNAEGGYKSQEKEDYKRLLGYHGEVLVLLNKIELIHPPHQKDDFITDQRDKMGVEARNVIPVAFNPHPLISDDPINIDMVREWIHDTLERKGKDLLFAKVARHKDKHVERWIRSASAAGAAIGALPIPGSDYGPLTALQVAMVARIAHLYEQSPTKQDIIRLIGQALTGRLGRQVFKAAFTALKGLGWIPGGWAAEVGVIALAATIAASTTYGLGKAAQAYYSSGMQITPFELQDIFKQSYEQYRISRKDQ